jgi:hypothetical protein
VEKAAFKNKKKNPVTSKLDLKNELLRRRWLWSIAMYGTETWTLWKVDRKYLESFEMWCWRRMDRSFEKRSVK